MKNLVISLSIVAAMVIAVITVKSLSVLEFTDHIHAKLLVDNELVSVAVSEDDFNRFWVGDTLTVYLNSNEKHGWYHVNSKRFNYRGELVDTTMLSTRIATAIVTGKN